MNNIPASQKSDKNTGNVLIRRQYLIYVSVNSKNDHPPGDPQGFAHFNCPWAWVFAPLSRSGVLNQSKSLIILKQKHDFRFVS